MAGAGAAAPWAPVVHRVRSLLRLPTSVRIGSVGSVPGVPWELLGTWFTKFQYGTVPAWFGGLSLLLAFYLFVRDRRRDDREQIDKVGVWALWETADSEPMPFIPHLIEIPEGVFFSLIARNTNDVPVTVHLINFVVRPRWAVPTSAYDAYVSREVQRFERSSTAWKMSSFHL
jgi:hypothetical protein